MTRRSFLQILAATLGMGALRKTPLTAVEPPGERTLVLGAGIAGLACAATLKASGQAVTVLEGRQRVGGRTWTVDLEGANVDLGAAWIHGERRNPLVSICNALDLPHDRHAYDVVLARETVDERHLTEAELGKLWRTINRRLRRMDVEVPDRSIEEELLSLFDGAYPDDPAGRLEWSITELLAAGPAGPIDRMSVAGLARAEGKGYGGEDRIVRGGYGVLVERLAEGLDIRLGEVVERIRRVSDGVEVTTSQGTHRGSHAVITLPLGVLQAGSIVFEPELPEWKQQAIGQLDMGNLEKVILRYDRVHWPELDGQLGIRMGRREQPFPAVYDLTPFAGAPLLAVLYYAGQARRAQDTLADDQLIAEGRNAVDDLLGRRLPAPSHTAVTRWRSDPFALGSYSYDPVGSTEQTRIDLAEPVGGRLLFAGEATSELFATVHGALESGVREASRLGASRRGIPGMR